MIYFEAWKLLKWFLINIGITEAMVQNLFKTKKKKKKERNWEEYKIQRKAE